ncbi:IclR family transcriptional regulator [Actinomadura hibisca]|uniref:IclR family transcriptional regulator n=1 Tax=Actinomadura hibisca TaxID=68565 RepID=UPI00082B2B71|nr:IclR family transcriptional regulator [Actinomadura hibisca]
MGIPAAATEPVLEASMLARAARILYTFADAPPELSLTDVVRRTGLPRSSAHRILDQLVQLKALERAGSRYRLGLSLVELGTLAAHQNRLRTISLPHLRMLRETTGAVVRLGVPDEHEVVWLEQIGALPGADAGPAGTLVGGRQHAVWTAAGRAMLAYADRDLVEAVLTAAPPRPIVRAAGRSGAAGPRVHGGVGHAGPDRRAHLASAAGRPHGAPPERVSRRTVEVEAARREIARVREHGVAVDREETRRGTVELAAALRDATGRPVAAISLCGPVTKTDVRRLTPLLLGAAGAICRALATPHRSAQGVRPAAPQAADVQRTRRPPATAQAAPEPSAELPPGTLDRLALWARRSDWM